jgi:hypothetical protein
MHACNQWAQTAMTHLTNAVHNSTAHNDPPAKAPQHWDLRCPGNSVHSTSLWLSGRLSLWPSAIDMHSAESCVASWKGAPAGYTKLQMHRCCTARTVCVHTNQPLHTVNQATEGTCSQPSCTRCICKQWDAVTPATLYPDRQCGTPTCTVKTHCTPNKKYGKYFDNMQTQQPSELHVHGR